MYMYIIIHPPTPTHLLTIIHPPTIPTSKSLLSSLHHLAWMVATEVSSSMLGLAVGTAVQTATVDWNYLDQPVFPDLRQVQRSSAQFTAVHTTLAK